MSSGELVPAGPQAGGSMVEVSTGRAAQEVQAMVLMAKRYPRDVTAAVQRIEQACKRRGLAEQSQYSYPRGKKKIVGPSIRLAEVLAQCWGNVDFGLIEVEQRDGESDVLSYCWDLETNSRNTKTFTVKHERHTKEEGVKHLTDPRDIYEHTANYGARRLRACILAIVPGDIQDLAVNVCNKTLRGKNDEPLIDRVRRMVGVFADFGVPQDAIERRLQHKVDACNEQDLVGLGKIYLSLKDGMSGREDWFELQASTADLDERADKAKKDPPKKPRKKAADSQVNPDAEPEVSTQVDPDVEASHGVDEPVAEEVSAQGKLEADYLEKVDFATSAKALHALETSLKAIKLRPNAKSRVQLAINDRLAAMTEKK